MKNVLFTLLLIHLEEGLYGFADRNTDAIVTVSEVAGISKTTLGTQTKKIWDGTTDETDFADQNGSFKSVLIR
ncbi:MAG: hypothetical protein ACKVU0_02130 [Saprospiraceae bacterium]